MILFHGSNIDIKAIDLSKSNVGKDFGCGFYLSAEKEQALAQALRKVELLGCGVPTLNVYDFDESCLNGRDISIAHFDGYSKDWADFVLKNRCNFTRKPVHNYDIVIGPIADDAVGYQIRRYTSGIISMEKFLEELKYMKGVTMQYFFGTEKAVSNLVKIEWQ